MELVWYCAGVARAGERQHRQDWERVMKLNQRAEDSLGDLCCVQMEKILKTNAADYSRLTRRAYICHEALCAFVER